MVKYQIQVKLSINIVTTVKKDDLDVQFVHLIKHIDIVIVVWY